MERRLGVVVVNYGSSSLLAVNLAQVAPAIPDALIIVVDNRTDDPERMRVEALGLLHGWTVLAPDSNLGFGEGVNAGAAAAFEAGVTDLLLLNPDATIGAPAVARLMSATEGGTDLVAPVIRSSAGRIWFAGSDLLLDDGSVRSLRRRPADRTERLIPWLTGACLLIPRRAWDDIGGFDPDYFLYWEDVDLSIRAQTAGHRVRVIEDAEAVHDAGGTQHEGGARAKSGVYYYYNIRNRLVFGAKHLSDEDYRRWVRTTPSAAWEVLSRGGRRQFIRRPGVFLSAVRGAWDGWRFGRQVRSARGR